VPPLILQPLVENAIRHGVSSKPDAGRIDLRAQEDHGSLRLEVSDNGPGFRPHAGAGVGLANARERLRQLFGDEACLTTGDALGGGALVTVVMPFRTIVEASR
jgi:sensor histidine kinase YesM